jgi:hypothetical protein
MFIVILVALNWLLRARAYASLKLGEECGVALFSLDGTMLVTTGELNLGRKRGPIRVWDVAQGRERFLSERQTQEPMQHSQSCCKMAEYSLALSV